MAERTEIAWCDSTFNPWIGCTKVLPGCDHCYAAQQDSFRKWTPAGWGAGQPRKRTSAPLWNQPLKWNAEPFYECSSCGWRGDVKAASAESLGRDFAVIVCPHGCDGVLRMVRRRVFCASLADVFDNEVDPQWRSDVLDLIARTPNLDWLLLTKRIGNVAKMTDEWVFQPDDETVCRGWPLENVWLGATIVDQEEADRDIPKLLATPARVRFLSMEPLLGPVGLDRLTIAKNGPLHTAWGMPEHYDHIDALHPRAPCRIDWLIAGGESGHGARPMHPDWARSLRDQCAAAGVPFLFKQWGEWVPWGQQPAPMRGPFDASNARYRRMTHAGNDVSLERVGKKVAGRLLDGVTHDGFPEVKS